MTSLGPEENKVRGERNGMEWIEEKREEIRVLENVERERDG